MGSKRHLLVEGRGVPLAIVVTGANRHDVSQIGVLLESFVIEHPLYGARLCLDAGYTGEPARQTVISHGLIPLVKGRGEEIIEKAADSNFKVHRWVVGVCHSWINRFRKLLVRFEKSARSYLGLLMFACSFIAFRKCDLI